MFFLGTVILVVLIVGGALAYAIRNDRRKVARMRAGEAPAKTYDPTRHTSANYDIIRERANGKQGIFPM